VRIPPPPAMWACRRTGKPRVLCGCAECAPHQLEFDRQLLEHAIARGHLERMQAICLMAFLSFVLVVALCAVLFVWRRNG
jgi:hypothetical protein